LGAAGATANTIVQNNTALNILANLDNEQIVIDGNGISFNGVNTGAIRNVANNNVFTGQIILNGHSTIGVDSASSLLINGPTPTITDNASVFNLIKELTGTLILASSSDYDGQTFVNQGALQIRHGSALGATGGAANTVVASGAAVQIQGGITTNESLTLNGTGIFGSGALLNTGGNNDWAGPVTLVAPTVAVGVSYVGDELEVSGIVGGPAGAGLNKVGPGRLTFSNNNNYNGATNVLEGTVRLQGTGKTGSGTNGTVVSANASIELDTLTEASR
jgi:autotransporter-associated beta strand protein